MHRTPEGQAFRFSLRGEGWATDEGLEADIFGGGTQEDIDKHIRVFNQLGESSLIDDPNESLKKIHTVLWLDGWCIWDMGEKTGSYCKPHEVSEGIRYFMEPEGWGAAELAQIRKQNAALMRARAAARKKNGIYEWEDPSTYYVPLSKPKPKPKAVAKPKPKPAAKPKKKELAVTRSIKAKPQKAKTKVQQQSQPKPAAKPNKQPQAKPKPMAKPRPMTELEKARAEARSALRQAAREKLLESGHRNVRIQQWAARAIFAAMLALTAWALW
jgi:pyruvate/2-oxoglutarate dehydrogenase complex dihydrolipoamide acyltransferase (E2) component